MPTSTTTFSHCWSTGASEGCQSHIYRYHYSTQQQENGAARHPTRTTRGHEVDCKGPTTSKAEKNALGGKAGLQDHLFPVSAIDLPKIHCTRWRHVEGFSLGWRAIVDILEFRHRHSVQAPLQEADVLKPSQNFRNQVNLDEKASKKKLGHKDERRKLHAFLDVRHS